MIWQGAASANRSRPPFTSPSQKPGESIEHIAHDDAACTNARNVEGKDHGHADRRNGA